MFIARSGIDPLNIHSERACNFRKKKKKTQVKNTGPPKGGRAGEGWEGGPWGSRPTQSVVSQSFQVIKLFMTYTVTKGSSLD